MKYQPNSRDSGTGIPGNLALLDFRKNQASFKKSRFVRNFHKRAEMLQNIAQKFKFCTQDVHTKKDVYLIPKSILASIPGVSWKLGHSLISLFLNFYSSQRNELGLKRNIKPLPLNHV